MPYLRFPKPNAECDAADIRELDRTIGWLQGFIAANPYAEGLPRPSLLLNCYNALTVEDRSQETLLPDTRQYAARAADEWNTSHADTGK